MPTETIKRPNTLADALAWLQAQLPEVVKGDTAVVPTKSGGKYTYTYATLADCNKAIMPLLGQAGLSFSAKPTMGEHGFVLTYTLRHASGESDEGHYPLPDPTRASAQEIGSAITYARRYALCAVTGIAPADEDDDGAAASQSPARSRPHAVPDEPKPEPSGRDWIAEAKALTDEEALLLLGRECNAFGEFVGEVKKALVARRQELAKGA